jgi:hypothetical protein
MKGKEMNKGISIKLFVQKNVKGYYYVTTSQPNICTDNDFALILNIPVENYQKFLMLRFNGKYSNTSNEIYFEQQEDAIKTMNWIYAKIRTKSTLEKSYLYK